MNAPEFADKLDREAGPTVPDVIGFAPGADAGGRAESDADAAHRRTGLVALVTAIMVVALAGALYFGSGPSRSDLQKIPDVDKGFAPELALPQAPGLSSASRAFSPSSALGAKADAVATLDTMTAPVEPLAEIGPHLAPEWSLALATRASAEAYADPPSPMRNTVAPRIAAPRTELPDPQGDALARMPALPAEAPMSTDELASSVARTPDAVGVSTEIVHPGITRRTYASLATILSQKVAECRQKGFLAAESCRAQVCSEHWGKVPACSRDQRDEPAILP